MRTVETIFRFYLNASLVSTLILCFLFLIRKTLFTRLSPRILHALWLLVLIKLLIPIAPQSPVSVFNLLPQTILDEWRLHTMLIAPDASLNAGLNLDSGSATEAPLLSSEQEALLAAPLASGSSEERLSPAGPSPAQNRTEQERVGIHWISISSVSWLGGILLFGAYTLLVTLKFRQSLRTARRLDNPEILRVLASCTKQLGLTQAIPVYETSHLRSPCLYGLTKPSIYLPADIVAIADSRQLTHILLHELTHLQRKDLWFNALWTLSWSLHWYNPFVWLTIKQMKADRELACDAAVLEVLGEREASSYGMTLLNLSRFYSRSSSPPINLSHFLARKSVTQRRITMISKFRQGSYKLSAAAILLILALSAVLLTNGWQTSSDSKLDATTVSTGSVEETTASFNLVRPIDEYFKWFSRLDRALDFAKFEFKVPDYVPEGYQLMNVDLNTLFAKAHRVNLIDTANINFVSNFLEKDEDRIQMIASRGNGSMLEHNLLWGAKYPEPAGQAPSYQQKEVTIGAFKGTLYTKTRGYEKRPEVPESFVWQDNGIWYAINYHSDNRSYKAGTQQQARSISQEELTKIIQSLVFPHHVKHVRYNENRNSFPLYDETDLRKAKNLLGFNVKFPFHLTDTGLTLTDSILLRAGDHNTHFSFRPDFDTLWNDYQAPYHSESDDTNGTLSLYQSKQPLFNTAKLSLMRKLEINGVEISAYTDPDHVYFGPFPSGNGSDKTKSQSQTYYLWKQGPISYAAIFLGMDKHQELNLKSLVLAPAQ